MNRIFPVIAASVVCLCTSSQLNAWEFKDIVLLSNSSGIRVASLIHDTIPPIPTYDLLKGHTFAAGFVTDFPDDSTQRSNLATIILDPGSSGNCELHFEPISWGQTRTTRWWLSYTNDFKPAFAKVIFSDADENDTTLYISVGALKSGDTAFMIQANDPVEVCNGAPVQLYAAGIGFSNFLWSTGDTARMITVKPYSQSLNIFVQALDSNATVHYSDTITVTGIAIAKPVIRSNGHTLSVDSLPEYFAFQWFLNKQPITGATQSRLIVNDTGTYVVYVVNVLGCIGASLSFIVSEISGVEQWNTPASGLFPNPVTDLLVLNTEQRPQQINTYNDVGEEIFDLKIDQLNALNFSIDVHALSSGIYFVRLMYSGSTKVLKFVKE